jgi:multicomponent Na+:H+ antiporter subunit D
MNAAPLFVVVPLGMAFLCLILSRLWKGMPDLCGNLTLGFLAVMSVRFLAFAGTTSRYDVGGWVPVGGIPVGISIVVDGLTVLMLLVVNITGFIAALYSIPYLSQYTDRDKYYTLFLLLIAGLNGVVVSGDLFNLFVFLEITAIAAYALVAFGVGAEELEASFKYQVLGGIASLFILLAIAMLYQMTRTLNLADMSRVIQNMPEKIPLFFISVFFLAGFGLKAALIPFHAWLPDAHPSAPAPVSAMLSGVVIKVLGVYAMCRVFFNVLGVTQDLMLVLRIMAVASMIFGVYLALGQWDFKRLLAYHSISQVGYVVLGIGLGTPLGIAAGLFHLVNHTAFKALLFLNAGAVEYSSGTRDLKRMAGLGRLLPVSAWTSLVASFSIAGIPPFSGFWSKLFIVIACLQAGQPVLAAFAILGSIMTLASFLKVRRYAFSDPEKTGFKIKRKTPRCMSLAMLVLAVFCTVMGLLFLPSVKAGLLGPAADVLVEGVGYAGRALGGVP